MITGFWPLGPFTKMVLIICIMNHGIMSHHMTDGIWTLGPFTKTLIIVVMVNHCMRDEWLNNDDRIIAGFWPKLDRWINAWQVFTGLLDLDQTEMTHCMTSIHRITGFRPNWNDSLYDKLSHDYWILAKLRWLIVWQVVTGLLDFDQTEMTNCMTSRHRITGFWPNWDDSLCDKSSHWTLTKLRWKFAWGINAQTNHIMTTHRIITDFCLNWNECLRDESQHRWITARGEIAW